MKLLCFCSEQDRRWQNSQKKEMSRASWRRKAATNHSHPLFCCMAVALWRLYMCIYIMYCDDRKDRYTILYFAVALLNKPNFKSSEERKSWTQISNHYVQNFGLPTCSLGTPRFQPASSEKRRAFELSPKIQSLWALGLNRIFQRRASRLSRRGRNGYKLRPLR
jgi:hypothetical protein